MQSPLIFNVMSCPHRRRAGRRAPVVMAVWLLVFLCAGAPSICADNLRLADGSAIEVDEAWEDAQGVWDRRGGVTHLIERERVRSIERAAKIGPTKAAKDGAAAVVKIVGGEAAAANALLPSPPPSPPSQASWIYLVGGARMEVDEATETADGLWYRRGSITIFIERARIDRVERESVAREGDAVATAKPTVRERKWSTGNARLDAMIKQNGAAHGVDPYLIFCVMEQESHFNSRALSPKGAAGLMQLMPGTAARFGVRNSLDPAQNIRGGTRYLKELLRMFRGRVDLVLASYNAGEGAVMKYGHRVPPYRETRNYVQRISTRYQRGI